MTRRRMFAGAAAAASLVAGLAVASPAQAAQSFTVVFTAGAEVTVDVYAPGLGPDANGTYTFDTTKDGIGGSRFCVGVSSTTGADAQCQLLSTGSFGALLGQQRPGLGASCLHSTGRGDVPRVILGGTNVVQGAGLKVEWPAAAGTILPFTLSLGNYATMGGQVVGQGAVQVTGAAPGTCGLGGPTRTFEVTGYGTGTI